MIEKHDFLIKAAAMLFLAAFLFSFGGCQADTSDDAKPEDIGPDDSGVKIANPASVFCIENEGKLEMRKDSAGGEYGVCIFKDNNECEEWAFFRGECGKEYRTSNNGDLQPVSSPSCKADSDCVAAECCHPTTCVAASQAPDCSATSCTMECKPGTLDCGYGTCKCQDGGCTAIIG